MRVSRDVMAQRHEQIITETTKMLRQRGIVGTSLADLMGAAGLTHGGFYKHFESKEELVAEATQRIFTELADRFRQRLEEQGPKLALKAYIDEYLSLGHLKRPEVGCPISSYGLDVGREQGVVRRTFTSGVKGMLALIAEGLSGTPSQRMESAIELLTMMSGSVALARATDDEKLARQILNSARKRADKIVM